MLVHVVLVVLVLPNLALVLVVLVLPNLAHQRVFTSSLISPLTLHTGSSCSSSRQRLFYIVQWTPIRHPASNKTNGQWRALENWNHKLYRYCSLHSVPEVYKCISVSPFPSLPPFHSLSLTLSLKRWIVVISWCVSVSLESSLSYSLSVLLLLPDHSSILSVRYLPRHL